MEERRAKRRRRRRTRKNKITLILAILVIIVAIFAIVKVASAINNAGKDYVLGSNGTDTVTEVSLTIPSGATTRDIADILYEKDLIGSKLLFRIKSKLGEYDGKYMQGDYTIAMGTEYEEIMKILQSGKVFRESIKITIPEGHTALQIAEEAEKAGICTAEEFLNEMNNGEFGFEFIKNLPDREYRLEGYLFPDTYLINRDGGAHELIEKMLSRFNEIYSEYVKTNADNSTYSMDQIITIASIIEAEIKSPDERTIASGVIYNRLNMGMMLQMDATVQYAQGLRKEVVTYDDLSIDSPYNTYKVIGLPLGPISNPGKDSLIAAVTPDDHDYLYYVLKDRTSGEHFYTGSYNEFLKAKEKYKSQF